MEESHGKYRTVIMGHTHVPKWITSHDMTYINSESWCSAKYPCSFIRADVEKESVALLRMELRDEVINTREYDELLTNKFH